MVGEGIQKPSASSVSRHFFKMQSTKKHSKGESEWIERRISELQQNKGKPVKVKNDVVNAQSLFTGQNASN